MAGGDGKKTPTLLCGKTKSGKKKKHKQPYGHIALNLLPSTAVAAAVPQSPKHILRNRSPSPIARAIAQSSKVCYSIIGPLPKANYNERYVGDDPHDEDPAYATVGTLTGLRSSDKATKNAPDSIKHRPPMPLPPEATAELREENSSPVELHGLYAKVDKTLTRESADEEAYSAETISDDEITDVTSSFIENQPTASLGRFKTTDHIDKNLAAFNERDADTKTKQQYPNFGEADPNKTWNSPSDFYQPDDFELSESATVTDNSYHDPTSIKSLDNNKSKHPMKNKKHAVAVSQSEPCLLADTRDGNDGVIDQKLQSHSKQKLILAKDVNSNEVPIVLEENAIYFKQKTEQIYQQFETELQRFNGLMDSLQTQQQQLTHENQTQTKPVIDNSQNENIVQLSSNLEAMQSHFHEQQNKLIKAFKCLEKEVANSYIKEKSLESRPATLQQEKSQELPDDSFIPLQTPKFHSTRLPNMSGLSMESQQFDEERTDLIRNINRRDDMLTSLRSSKRQQAEHLVKQLSQIEREKEELELKCYQKEVENTNLQQLISNLKSSCVYQISIEDHRDELQQQRDEFQITITDLQRRNEDMAETVSANKRETKRLALLLADNKATLMKERSETQHSKKEIKRSNQQIKLLRQKLEAAHEREKLTQETLHTVLKVAEKNVSEKKQIENLFDEQEATNNMRTSHIIQKANRYKKLVSEFKDLKTASTKKVSHLERRLIEREAEMKDLSFDYQMQIDALRKSLRSRDVIRKNNESRLIDDELHEICNSAKKQNQDLMLRLSS